jgi:DNA-binding NarL/FixJ family response regulator
MKQIETNVLRIYTATKSLKATAKEAGVSEHKVRKILVTHGKLEGSEAYDKITGLIGQGMAAPEIAEKLGVSVNYINSYLPYTRGVYKDEPSANALRIRKHRENKAR